MSGQFRSAIGAKSVDSQAASPNLARFMYANIAMWIGERAIVMHQLPMTDVLNQSLAGINAPGEVRRGLSTGRLCPKGHGFLVVLPDALWQRVGV